MHVELGPVERRALLADYFSTIGALRAGGGGDLLGRAAALEARYEAALPVPAIARDPYSAEPLTYPIDTGGLDGLWWRYDSPVRPPEEDELPDGVFALTGALRLGDRIEQFPFLCKPGPEAPFVIPRILAHDTVRAVVSELPVGPHTGYAIVYFSNDPPEIPRFNTWGTDLYVTYRGWDSVVEDAEPLDFDLEPWVESEKLLWIAPGDSTLELRAGTNGCPYLDLPGRRNFVRIQAGRVTDGPAPPAAP
jgi:hypothetical protein